MAMLHAGLFFIAIYMPECDGPASRYVLGTINVFAQMKEINTPIRSVASVRGDLCIRAPCDERNCLSDCCVARTSMLNHCHELERVV
mmetsp:Transcript_13509/g.29237  ORF Transcript_13509/g.29237 Transcript_13509/m.29237 type:complete len:87 (+) Transcript_13509:82-342(+)